MARPGGICDPPPRHACRCARWGRVVRGVLVEDEVNNFRPIPGFPGYEASPSGEVVSWHPLRGTGDPPTTPRPLRSRAGSDAGLSHRQYGLASNGTKTNITAGRVVLLTYGEPMPTEGGPWYACTKDGDANNCTVENLFWATSEQMAQKKLKTGGFTVGETHQHAVLSDADVAAIRSSKASKHDLSTQYGVTTFTIYKIQGYRARIGYRGKR